MKWLNNTDLLVNPDEDDYRKRIIFRQVGWQGQTGRFYELKDDSITDTEPGSFCPMYIQIAPE